MSEINPTFKGVRDTRTGITHVRDTYAAIARGRDSIPDIEEFVAWLNAQRGNKGRYEVAEVKPLFDGRRTGLSSKYTQFLKGAPHIRIKQRLEYQVNRNGFVVTNRRGVWYFEHAEARIEELAKEAAVSWNEARDALYAWLIGEFGAELAERIQFPPLNAKKEVVDHNDSSRGFFRHGHTDPRWPDVTPEMEAEDNAEDGIETEEG